MATHPKPTQNVSSPSSLTGKLTTTVPPAAWPATCEKTTSGAAPRWTRMENMSVDRESGGTAASLAQTAVAVISSTNMGLDSARKEIPISQENSNVM